MSNLSEELPLYITEQKIAADVKAIATVRVRFIEFLLSLGIDDQEKDGWKLVFTEMVNNAIEHGSESRPEHSVYVRWWTAKNSVILETQDIGKGPPEDLARNPTLPEDPLAEGGRGLFIIHNFADTFDHWRKSDAYIARVSKNYERLNNVLPLNPEMYAILDELSNCYESLSLFDRLAANLLQDESINHFVQSGLDMFMDAHEYEAIHFELRHPEKNAVFSRMTSIKSHGVFGGLDDQGYQILAASESINWMQGRSPCPFNKAGEFFSGCCVPLYVEDAIVGLIAVGYQTEGKQILSNDIRNLRALSDIIGLSVSRELMEIERDEKKRIDAVMSVATGLQQQLLPLNKKPPAIPGYELFTSSLSAHEVAGDFVEVRQNSAGEFVGCVIDVMGKGVSAAILAGIFRSQFIAYAHRGGQLASFMEGVNDALESQLEGATMFITAYVFKLNPVSHDLSYVAAGHPPALLYRANGCLEQLVSIGPPLGLFKDMEYAQNHVSLEPGDRLVVVTDGLYEWSDSSSIFGWQPMVNWFTSHRKIDAAMLWKSLQAMIFSARKSLGIDQEDDETLLILTRNEE